MGNALTIEDIARSHRWHAVACNNLAWTLADQSKRTSLDDEEMLNAAHASAFHWSKVGTELHHARAKMLLGHVHARLGMGKTALVFAQESYDHILSHESPDWEIAFAHAILAHAAYAQGEGLLYKEHYVKAQELGEKIRDPEDKKIFLITFAGIPAPR